MSDATQYGDLMPLATADEIGKTQRLLGLYGGRGMIGGSRTGRLPVGNPTEDWGNLERSMKLSKQNFQRLAQMTREIDAAIAASTPLPPDVHEQVMGVIRARLAFVCAEGNPAFDSFRFDAACKGTRE